MIRTLKKGGTCKVENSPPDATSWSSGPVDSNTYSTSEMDDFRAEIMSVREALNEIDHHVRRLEKKLWGM